ncbi:hypothetical protein DOC35_19470 [Salmonella enterica subsp. enterica]|nr:hypothetical protein [Salmonella enterica subsp. enterica]
MTPKKQWFTMGAIALVVVAALHSCGDSSSTDTAKEISDASAAASDTAPAAPVDPKSKIADYAVDSLTPDQYPKLFKKLGKKGAKDAEAGAYAAAYRVAQSDDCDRVDTASITNESTKTKQEYFVNCANAKQWRFKASELKDSHGKWYTADNAPKVGTSDSDRRKAEMENERNQHPASYSQCEEAIRNQLDYPSAAEFHNLAGRADFVNPHNENVIQIEFEAKNGYGNMLPFVANCIFKHDGTLTTDIYKR